MNRITKIILLVSIAVIGLVSGYLMMARTVTVTVDGEPASVRTHALTVGGALRSAGYHFSELDEVSPAANTWLSKTTSIQLNRARLVRVIVQPDGKIIELETASLSVREILGEAGITPGAKDTLLLNGAPLDPASEIVRTAGLTLEYRPALSLHVILNGEEKTLTSSAGNLAAALWEAGIHLRGGDRISIPPEAPLQEGMNVAITTGREVAIEVDGTTVTGFSAAENVYGALIDSGITLQDMDYSQPGGDEPVPEDGHIKVVRVYEQLINEQKMIAFETESLPDNTMEMNQREVIQAGVPGVMAARVKVRYEDGTEVAREPQSDIILAEPVAQVVHYGTLIADKPLDTPDGPISYYFALNVTATSYSPCNSGVPGKCYPSTRLGIPVQKGVVAVHSDWYSILAGTKVYVPGYGVGVIADTGSYPYNHNWVDLGYSDSDYVSWGAKSVTVYFLSPAPAGFTGALP